MSIESATYISDLVVTNPLGTDQKSTADDHLRLIKSTIKATFPNVTGAVTATHTQLNLVASTSFTFQSGVRLAFAQAAAPTGWTQAVTDSENNRMLRVVNTAGGGVGGSSSPILNNVVPAHTHGITTGTESVTHNHAISDPTHSHGVGSYGSGNPHSGSATASGVGLGVGGDAVYNGTAAASTGISLGIESAFHTHSGTTDNGSSSTNWTPRYIDLIICAKT